MKKTDTKRTTGKGTPNGLTKNNISEIKESE